MKRLALLAFATLLVVSCSDDMIPTGPQEEVRPSLSTLDGFNSDRISVLINALYPTEKQLLTKALKKWESIQEKMAKGSVEEAQGKVLELSDKTVEYLLEPKLLPPPPGDPELPETAAEGVAELVMRLFVYVGWSGVDAAGRYPDFYTSVYDEHPDFFAAASDSPDSGFGIILPEDDEPTVIITEHTWAAIEAQPGSVDEPVFISMELIDDASCNVNSGLDQALGCWDIRRVPEGSFLIPVRVETCVDPSSLSNPDLWPYLLVHKKEEDTGEVTALPWANPEYITDEDCADFIAGGAESPVAYSAPEEGLWGALRHGLARVLLPEPLVAHPPIGRPPMGIGGLESSFTLHFGAVPDNFPEDLLGWWSADGHYFDLYRNSDGEAIGSVPFVPGVSGEAFDLSGSGTEVLIQPLSSEIQGLQELTVATWVYLNPTGADQIQRFVTVGGGPDMAVLRQEGGGNRMLHFYMHFEDTPDLNNIEAIRVDNAFQTGCFHFFAGTYGEDDFMRAYLDGVQVGSRWVPGATVLHDPDADYAKLGASGGAGYPAEEMDGYLDEVMIFDRALDPSEIQALYDLGEGNLCTPGYFPMTYPEVRVDPTYVGADPTIVPTLAEAMTLVHPGGTVWMADGIHDVENVLVSKPVTIDEVSDATAVVRNDLEPRAIRIGGFGSGVVTIQNLDFVNNVEGDLGENRSVSIHAIQGWDQVVIQHNTFFSPYENASTLLQIDETHVAGASATIQENTFSGARWAMYSVGTSGSSDPFVTVDNNTFTGHTNGAIQFREEAYGIVSNNNLTNCGVLSCIYISGASRVAVTDNTINDHTAHPGGDPEYYHTGIYSSSPIGPISGNTFDGCGWGSCIEVNGAYGAVTAVHHNTITGYATDHTEVGILAYGGDYADIGDAHPPTVTITDNVIVGVGTLGSGFEDWNNPFYHGGILVRNAYATDVSRNQITNAAYGIYMFQNGFVYAGSDNEFDQTLASIRGGANAGVTMTGNDFTTTVYSFMDNDATLTGSLRCNWWGDAVDPSDNVSPPGSTAVALSPWADGPVANDGGGSCLLSTYGISGTVAYSATPLGSGIPVNLYEGPGLGGSLLASTVTDLNGQYEFADLFPGYYLVRANPPTPTYIGVTENQVEIVASSVVQDIQIRKPLSLTGPGDGVNQRTYQEIQFDWEANPEAEAGGEYWVEVTETLVPTPAVYILNTGITTNTTLVDPYSVGLTPGMIYRWSVKAYDSDGRWVGATDSFRTFRYGYTIAGHVTRDGAPLTGVTVGLSGYWSANTVSDAAGFFKFVGLPEENPSWTVEISGFPPEVTFPFTSHGAAFDAWQDSVTVDFSGAYYPSVPTSGIGSATSWVVSQPSIGVNLCNGEGSTACAATETITLEARGTGPSSTFEPEWNEVHFYFRETTPGAVYRYAAAAAYASENDNGVTRQIWWTATLDINGLGIPHGTTIEVIAIGVDTGPVTPVTYHTPANGNITVVNGTIGGDD